jgi:hypothetical protein
MRTRCYQPKIRPSLLIKKCCYKYQTVTRSANFHPIQPSNGKSGIPTGFHTELSTDSGDNSLGD